MNSSTTMIYWKSRTFWIGKLKEHPEIMSQGRTLAELEENLKDAYRLMVLPTVEADVSGMNRKARRSAVQLVKKAQGAERTRISTKRARLLAKAYRNRDRYARMSLSRIEDLAAAGDETAQRFLQLWVAQQEEAQ